MTEFHLLRPWWLLALVPLLLFYWRLLFMQKNRSGWHQWLPPHLSQALVASATQRPTWSAHRLALFWLISTLALSGPTWERLPQPVYQLETGQVVIMDMSPSLSAQDITPDRLTRLRFKAMDLVKSGLDGDTGLIAYADDAFTISPLTADNNNLLSLIPSLSPEIMPVAGSEPLRALKLADQLLSNAGYAEGDIYWLTDGISTQDQLPLTNFLRQQPHRVSILGVGTRDGAPIRDSEGTLLRDRYGQVVVAKLNGGRLKDLASITGGQYQQVRGDNQDVAALIDQPPLTRQGKDSEQQQQGDQWQDRGPYLALLLIPLILFSWRRGGSLGQWMWLGLLPLIMTSHPVKAQADATTDWWKNAEQQAQGAYQSENYQQAAELATDPMRRGAAQYRAGNYQAAADSFAKEDTAAGWYNRGNALAQQQQYSAAQEAFQQALEKRPNWSQAQQNSALMEQLQKQQQQQQQQKGNQDEGEQQQENDDSRDGDGQSQDNSDHNPAGSQQSDSSSQHPSAEQQQESAEQSPDAEQEQQQSTEAGVSQQDSATEQSSAEQQQRNRQTQFSDDIDPEKAQQLEQWMKRIPDDPSILLRNKMLLESQRRNQRRASQPQGEKKKW